ncbi:hypothetical protein LPJ74_003373 [Coemansia sp. RSA 1843]|nr:hypothetical protein LPJ74_003373 [Coemansia sp. RSA 1843]
MSLGAMTPHIGHRSIVVESPFALGNDDDEELLLCCAAGNPWYAAVPAETVLRLPDNPMCEGVALCGGGGGTTLVSLLFASVAELVDCDRTFRALPTTDSICPSDECTLSGRLLVLVFSSVVAPRVRAARLTCLDNVVLRSGELSLDIDCDIMKI